MPPKPGPPAAVMLAGLALTLVNVTTREARADTPALPRSLAEAIRAERADALPVTSFYDTPSLARTRPGNLLRREAFTSYALPPGARAERILYHSLDAGGRSVATSGVVLIPAGAPPHGGWPVIAWAHGTAGVARQCAPSLTRDLLYGEEGLMPMVRAGFAVVATDYHGLGTVGPHQYVNKIAQAHDVIYSVIAAHAAVPLLSQRWAVVGHSQGGLAAWGVAEMQHTLRDPGYLGAISVAGAADLRQVLLAMGDSDSAAAFYLTYMAYAIRARSPQFAPADMLAGEALRHYPDATTRGCWYYGYARFLGTPPGRNLKAGWDAAPAVQQFFRDNELGVAPIGGPLLVIGGEADRTVPFDSLKATATRACRNGIALGFRAYPGLDHGPVMDRSTPDQLAWIRARLAGKPAESDCATLRR